MKTKNGTYVKKDIEIEEDKKQPAKGMLIDDQLELLADIIIDQYLNSLYEQTNEAHE